MNLAIASDTGFFWEVSRPRSTKRGAAILKEQPRGERGVASSPGAVCREPVRERRRDLARGDAAVGRNAHFSWIAGAGEALMESNGHTPRAVCTYAYARAIQAFALAEETPGTRCSRGRILSFAPDIAPVRLQCRSTRSLIALSRFSRNNAHRIHAEYEISLRFCNRTIKRSETRDDTKEVSSLDINIQAAGG